MGCKICPQDKLAAAHGSKLKRMCMDDYREILGKIPEDIEVHFSGFAEPYLHPDAAEMMFIAAETGRKVYLYSTLMGLRESIFLANTRFKFISIHAPDKINLRIDAAKWFKQYDLFLQAKKNHEVMCLATREEDADPEIVKGLADRGMKLRLLDTQLSRGGNLWKPRHLAGPIKCGMNRWHDNVVLPNGDVVVCCMDYGLTMPLGNLLRQPYEEIRANAAAYAANNNPPDDSICRDCEWACQL